MQSLMKGDSCGKKTTGQKGFDLMEMTWGKHHKTTIVQILLCALHLEDKNVLFLWI
jgi:hypothetical protein